MRVLIEPSLNPNIFGRISVDSTSYAGFSVVQGLGFQIYGIRPSGLPIHRTLNVDIIFDRNSASGMAFECAAVLVTPLVSKFSKCFGSFAHQTVVMAFQLYRPLRWYGFCLFSPQVIVTLSKSKSVGWWHTDEWGTGAHRHVWLFYRRKTSYEETW